MDRKRSNEATVTATAPSEKRAKSKLEGRDLTSFITSFLFTCIKTRGIGLRERMRTLLCSFSLLCFKCRFPSGIFHSHRQQPAPAKGSQVPNCDYMLCTASCFSFYNHDIFRSFHFISRKFKSITSNSSEFKQVEVHVKTLGKRNHIQPTVRLRQSK